MAQRYTNMREILAQIREEVDLTKLDENKDPKIVKAVDKLKKGDTVEIGYDSSIKKGHKGKFKVTAKNTVNKGRVVKTTLQNLDNPKGVKHFIYQYKDRDGAFFAIGDMGATMTSLKAGYMEDVDSSDTGGEEEVSMAVRQIAAIKHFLDDIETRVKQEGDMEEWYQNKLTKAHDYLKTIYAYGKGDMAEETKQPVQWPSQPLEEKLKVSDGLGAWIDDFKKSDAPQFQGKSDEEKKNMAIAAFTDAGGKLESVEEGFTPKEIKMAIGVAADKRYKGGNYTGAVNTIEKIKKGLSKHPQVAAVLKRLNTDFDPELEEMREPYAVIDTADGNKVVGTASDEKGAKSIITSAELPPMKIKDKKTLKIVKVKKKQMIGQPIKEEDEKPKEPEKSDGAKAVDQARADKKATRIAQLQLQIAKAQETINKLNAQEK